MAGAGRRLHGLTVLRFRIREDMGSELIRSGFKTPSKAQWLRCRPPINAHIQMYAALSRSACALPLNLI